jgi:cytochrome c oxidase cbb3-type subunit 3
LFRLDLILARWLSQTWHRKFSVAREALLTGFRRTQRSTLDLRETTTGAVKRSVIADIEKMPTGLCLIILTVVANSIAMQRGGPVRASSRSGEQGYVTHCSMCHGLDGRGGEHAPDVASGASVRQLSDFRLLSILQNGIPAGGMPSFGALGPARLKLIIRYVRTLQGEHGATSVSGNPARGRALFFSKAECSSCHMIEGAGGFLGPDLSSYALSQSPEEIRQAILNPNKNLASENDTVVAVTRGGQKFVGIARNEDNFSLQLQTADGKLHLLMRSSLASVRHEPWSLMPSDYASKLSNHELRDLVSFLVKAASETNPTEREIPARGGRGGEH